MRDLTETRQTDPVTGAQKGAKAAAFDLLPWDALWALAEVYGRGAEKYERRNWEKGMSYGLMLAAAHRHLASWANGEDVDPESGQPHLGHAAFHVLGLLAFSLRGDGLDDRNKVWGGTYKDETPEETEAAVADFSAWLEAKAAEEAPRYSGGDLYRPGDRVAFTAIGLQAWKPSYAVSGTVVECRPDDPFPVRVDPGNGEGPRLCALAEVRPFDAAQAVGKTVAFIGSKEAYPSLEQGTRGVVVNTPENDRTYPIRVRWDVEACPDHGWLMLWDEVTFR